MMAHLAARRQASQKVEETAIAEEVAFQSNDEGSCKVIDLPAPRFETSSDANLLFKKAALPVQRARVMGSFKMVHHH